MRSIDDPFSYFPLDEADLEEPDYQTSKEDEMVSQFARNMPMDYQRIYPTPDKEPNPLYADFGNYNFGAVAAAAGYSLTEALIAAAKVNASNFFDPGANIVRIPFTGGPGNPWLSNPTNNAFIAQGYNDYMAGKIKASRQ